MPLWLKGRKSNVAVNQAGHTVSEKATGKCFKAPCPPRPHSGFRMPEGPQCPCQSHPRLTVLFSLPAENYVLLNSLWELLSLS